MRPISRQWPFSIPASDPLSQHGQLTSDQLYLIAQAYEEAAALVAPGNRSRILARHHLAMALGLEKEGRVDEAQRELRIALECVCIRGADLAPGSRFVVLGNHQETVVSVEPDDPSDPRFRFQPPEVIADAILVKTTTPGVSYHCYRSELYPTW